MLTLEVLPKLGVNNSTMELVEVKACTLHLEHSLLAISKWEAKHHKIFLGDEKRTMPELKSYAKCMCLDKNVDDAVFSTLSPKEFEQILAYIEDPMTATTFGPSDDDNVKDTETMSSELLYYYMFRNDIPISCEKWHINRLLTLLRICGIKDKVSGKPKKSQSQLLQKYAAMHAARKKAKK